MAKLFTPEELEELRRADAEVDEEYSLSPEDMALSRRLDREAKLDRMDNKGRKIADYQAAYYEANKEKIADYQAAYYEANKEKIAAQKAAWQKKNREKWNAYQRAYRAKKKAASDGANIESGKSK